MIQLIYFWKCNFHYIGYIFGHSSVWNRLKRGLGSTVVNKSINCPSLLTYITFNTLFLNNSHIKWWRTEISLLCWWNSGFLINWVALVFTTCRTNSSILILQSLNNFLYHTSSFPAVAALTYSASIVDGATNFCFLLCQLTALLAYIYTTLLTDRRVSRSLAWSTSLKITVSAIEKPLISDAFQITKNPLCKHPVTFGWPFQITQNNFHCKINTRPSTSL